MGKHKRLKPYPDRNTRAWLYLIEREAPTKLRGTLKIGITCNPAARMREHGTNRFDGHVTRRHFCASGPRALMLEIERAGVRAFARMGKQRGHHLREEFDGIAFDDAVRTVRRLAMRVREAFPSLADHRSRVDAEAAAWHAFRRRMLDLSETA